MRNFLTVSALVVLTACGGGGGGGDEATGPSTNDTPIVNAGVLQNILAGTAVTLDGSASSDANGDALTYAWTLTSKPAGSAASLSNPTSPKPTFQADVAGTYVASLVVNDGKASSQAGTVTVTATVANAAPVANAGTAQNTIAGTLVTLDGSASSDANGDSLTYAWTLTSKPIGSSAALSSATSTKPTFTADVAGTYVASLTVNDGKVNSISASVGINAEIRDTSGPSVGVISVTPVTVDVTSSSQVVTASVVVSDATGINLNALPTPYWFNNTDVAGTRIDSPWVLTAGDSKQATFTSTVTIPVGAKPGQWTVGSIAFKDTLGYSSTNGGYQQFFTVTSSLGTDTSGPSVGVISVTPVTVDVTSSSQVVTASVVVSDATGINLNALPTPYWFNNTDVAGTRIDSPWVLTAGDSKQATFTSTVTIPVGAKPGQWSVGSIAFKDTLGYSSTNGGYQQFFTVK